MDKRGKCQQVMRAIGGHFCARQMASAQAGAHSRQHMGQTMVRKYVFKQANKRKQATVGIIVNNGGGRGIIVMGGGMAAVQHALFALALSASSLIFHILESVMYRMPSARASLQSTSKSLRAASARARKHLRARPRAHNSAAASAGAPSFTQHSVCCAAHGVRAARHLALRARIYRLFSRR